MKNIIKLGLILGLFAVVSCALLAVVNNFTAPVIKKLEAEKEQQAPILNKRFLIPRIPTRRTASAML